MGQKCISKKELKCIEGHLAYCIKAIMRDSRVKEGELVNIEKYDSKSREIFGLLCTAYTLVDESNEE